MSSKYRSRLLDVSHVFEVLADFRGEARIFCAGDVFLPLYIPIGFQRSQYSISGHSPPETTLTVYQNEVGGIKHVHGGMLFRRRPFWPDQFTTPAGREPFTNNERFC